MMEKKKEKTIPVSVSTEDMNALLCILTMIADSDQSEQRREGQLAEKIRDSIMQYRKPCKRKEGKGFVLYFLESEAAMMIKYFAMTVKLIMEPKEKDTA